MKRFIIPFLVMLCASISAQTLNLMRIERNDGSMQYVPLDKIKQVDFVEKEEWQDSDPEHTTFDDFFDVKITRCERIADVLILEYSVTNRTPDELTVSFDCYGITSKDDLDKSYLYSTYSAWEGQDFSNKEHSETIGGYATKTGKFRIEDFNSSNKVSYVTISPKVYITNVELFDNFYTFTSEITDVRPTKKGVQTCDKLLNFKVLGCERVGDVLIVNYSIENKSGEDILDFSVNTYGELSKDDLGNSYLYNTNCSFNGSGYSKEQTIDINADATVKGAFRIEKFDASDKASYISLSPKTSSESLVLEANRANFVKIDITDNRGGVVDNVRSCDRNLEFKVTDATSEDGVAIINFTITNKSESIDIEDFLFDTYGITCKDNLENSYSYNVNCAFDEQAYSTKSTTSIKAGKNVRGSLKVNKFDSSVSYITIYPNVSSQDYILDDDKNVYFLQIPIK